MILPRQKKEPRLMTMYVRLALQYFAPFVSFHFSAIEENLFYSNFAQLLKFVPDELLLAQFLRQKKEDDQ